MAVEVLSPPVVDGGRARVRVTRRGLDVTERDAGVEGGHDEHGSQHVRVHGAEATTLADGPHLPVGGAAIETFTIMSTQDRSFAALADGQVDSAGGAGDQGDGGRLVALAQDPQRPVATFLARGVSERSYRSTAGA